MHLLAVRLFDPDEFEHVHAGFCLALGQLPYRDFFEHHGPLTYVLSAPLMLLLPHDEGQLIAHRVVSLGFVLLTLWAVWRIACRLYGRSSGIVALGWLVTCPWFVEKSIEWRPDVPAMCLATLAVLALCRLELRRSALVAGFLFGLASMCTQKIAPLVLGAGLGTAISGIRLHAGLTNVVVRLGLGFVAPWSVAVAVFSSMDALEDFFRCVIWYPVVWPSDVADAAATLSVQLWSPKDWSPGQQSLVALGLAVGVGDLFRRRACCQGRAVVVLAAVMHLAMALFLPAAYLQYYLLALPLLAVLAGGATVRLCRNIRFGRSAGHSFCTTVKRQLPVLASLIAVATGLVVSPLDFPARWKGLASWHVGVSQDPYGWIDRVGITVVVLGAASLMLHARASQCLIWSGVAVLSVGRVAVPHVYWNNDLQLSDLRVVHETVAPNELVQDGFTGLGCLRPHASYWWWINDHSRRLIEQEQATEALSAAMWSGLADVIILDQGLSQFLERNGPGTAALLQRYQPVECRLRSIHAVLLVRRGM